MKKKTATTEDMQAKLKEVMSFMGQRSAEARKKAWGAKGFKKRMTEYGKLGGRPKKTGKSRKGTK